MTDVYKISALSESAVIVSFRQEISPEVHNHVMGLLHRIESEPFRGYIECVPAYASLTVFFDFFELSKYTDSVFEYVRDVIGQHLEKNIKNPPEAAGRLIEIPVDYSGDDLAYVAEFNGLTVEEVVAIHSSAVYRVYMLGFLPGFAYLGGMDARIATPRRQNPRLLVGAGSVGIAGAQTGIYPVDSPGGWQIIGKTDVELFDPEAVSPVLFRVGDSVKFVVT